MAILLWVILRVYEWGLSPEIENFLCFLRELSCKSGVKVINQLFSSLKHIGNVLFSFQMLCWPFKIGWHPWKGSRPPLWKPGIRKLSIFNVITDKCDWSMQNVIHTCCWFKMVSIYKLTESIIIFYSELFDDCTENLRLSVIL